MLRILQFMLTCNAYSLFLELLRAPIFVHLISCKVKDKLLSWKLHGHSACKFIPPPSEPKLLSAIFQIFFSYGPPKIIINMYTSFMISKFSMKQDKFNIKKQPTICWICILVTSHQSRMHIHQNIYVSMFPKYVIFSI